MGKGPPPSYIILWVEQEVYEFFNRRCLYRQILWRFTWDSPKQPSAEGILLRDMWNLELHKNPDFVEDTADQAKQEMKMENTLKKLQKEHGSSRKRQKISPVFFVGLFFFCWGKKGTFLQMPSSFGGSLQWANKRGYSMDDISWYIMDCGTPIFSLKNPQEYWILE